MPKEGQLPSEKELDQFANRAGLSIPELDGDPRFTLPEISVRKGVLGYLTKLKNANGQSAATEAAVESAGDRKSLPWFVRWSPATALPIVAVFGIAAGGTEANDDGYLPIPTPEPVATSLPANPDYIPNEEEPNPAGPPVDFGVVVPGPSDEFGDPGNNPTGPIPADGCHEDPFQIEVKKRLDANRNGIFDVTDPTMNATIKYSLDENGNGKIDPGEKVQSNMELGPDGVEIFNDSICGDAKGLGVFIEEIQRNPNFQPVPGYGDGWAYVDSGQRVAVKQFLNANIEVTPPPPPPVQPTPTATKPPEGPQPTPVKPPEKPPIVPPPVVLPPVVVQPPVGPQPPVCPGPDLAAGVVLPPEFIGAPPFEIEAKCELIDHDLRQSKEHKEIIDVMTDQHADQTEILVDIENDVDLLLKRAKEYSNKSSREHGDLGIKIDELGVDLGDKIDGSGLKWWQGLLIGMGGAAGFGTVVGGAVLANRLADQRRRDGGPPPPRPRRGGLFVWLPWRRGERPRRPLVAQEDIDAVQNQIRQRLHAGDRVTTPRGTGEIREVRLQRTADGREFRVYTHNVDGVDVEYRDSELNQFAGAGQLRRTPAEGDALRQRAQVGQRLGNRTIVGVSVVDDALEYLVREQDQTLVTTRDQDEVGRWAEEANRVAERDRLRQALQQEATRLQGLQLTENELNDLAQLGQALPGNFPQLTPEQVGQEAQRLGQDFLDRARQVLTRLNVPENLLGTTGANLVWQLDFTLRSLSAEAQEQIRQRLEVQARGLTNEDFDLIARLFADLGAEIDQVVTRVNRMRERRLQEIAAQLNDETVDRMRAIVVRLLEEDEDEAEVARMGRPALIRELVNRVARTAAIRQRLMGRMVEQAQAGA